MGVSDTFVRTGRTVAKLKDNVCRIRFLPSNGVIVKIILNDVDVNFQGKTFQKSRF